MIATPAATRFTRKTTLGPNEYRKNFKQIDDDIIAALLSPAAKQVTTLMSTVYLALIHVPLCYWEKQGVLRLTGEEREGKWLTAWDQLLALTDVASATAHKALTWMHEQGIIGYSAHKNGVGIRIFFNRAAASIGYSPSHRYQKNLDLVHASSIAAQASFSETPFKVSYADLDILDNCISHAPEGGAMNTIKDSQSIPASVPKSQHGGRKFTPTATTPPAITATHSSTKEKQQPALCPQADPLRTTAIPSASTVSIVGSVVRDIETRLISTCVREVQPRLVSQAVTEIETRLAATYTREQDRMREWFLTHALPKAARVAQRESYKVMQREGSNGSSWAQVGKRFEDSQAVSTTEVARSQSPCGPLGPVDEKAVALWTLITKELWNCISDKQALDAWFNSEAITPVKVEGQQLFLQSRDAAVREWVSTNYAAELSAALTKVANNGQGWQITWLPEDNREAGL